MKTSLIGSMIVLSAVSFTAAAEDDSWGNVIFQPRAYVGYADYSLESGTLTQVPEQGNPQSGKLLFGLPARSKIDISGLIGGIGATLATGRFFGDVYYQAIPSETAYSASSAPSGANTASFGAIDAKHYDWAISLGYMITDQWSVFAGYKAGQTESNQSSNVNRPPPGSQLIQTLSYSTNFDQDGPFIGTSYSFIIGPGALTLKAAYAYLDGEYTSDFNSTCLPPNTNCPNVPLSVLQQFSWKGDSNAYSLGLSWTQSITENLGYSLGANYHQYKFDASGSQRYTATIGGQPIPAASGTLEGGNLTEELFTLTASLFYRF